VKIEGTDALWVITEVLTDTKEFVLSSLGAEVSLTKFYDYSNLLTSPENKLRKFVPLPVPAATEVSNQPKATGRYANAMDALQQQINQAQKQIELLEMMYNSSVGQLADASRGTPDAETERMLGQAQHQLILLADIRRSQSMYVQSLAELRARWPGPFSGQQKRPG